MRAHDGEQSVAPSRRAEADIRSDGASQSGAQPGGWFFRTTDGKQSIAQSHVWDAAPRRDRASLAAELPFARSALVFFVDPMDAVRETTKSYRRSPTQNRTNLQG